MVAIPGRNVIAEAEKNNINILGIAEHRWGGQGHFSTIEGGKMIYSGKEKSGLSGCHISMREIDECTHGI